VKLCSRTISSYVFIPPDKREAGGEGKGLRNKLVSIAAGGVRFQRALSKRRALLADILQDPLSVCFFSEE